MVSKTRSAHRREWPCCFDLAKAFGENGLRPVASCGDGACLEILWGFKSNF